MNDLALVWPVFRDLNQSGAHGILANVLPFLCVAFIASHYMIKKSGLPKGAWLLLWKCLRHRSLQSLDPITENKVLIATNKKMEMVRHDHIPTESDIEL